MDVFYAYPFSRCFDAYLLWDVLLPSLPYCCFRFLNVTLACCLMYVIAGMNEGWRDLRRLATAQVKKHTARVKGVHGKGEKHTAMCL